MLCASQLATSTCHRKPCKFLNLCHCLSIPPCFSHAVYSQPRSHHAAPIYSTHHGLRNLQHTEWNMAAHHTALSSASTGCPVPGRCSMHHTASGVVEGAREPMQTMIDRSSRTVWRAKLQQGSTTDAFRYHNQRFDTGPMPLLHHVGGPPASEAKKIVSRSRRLQSPYSSGASCKIQGWTSICVAPKATECAVALHFQHNPGLCQDRICPAHERLPPRSGSRAPGHVRRPCCSLHHSAAVSRVAVRQCSTAVH